MTDMKQLVGVGAACGLAGFIFGAVAFGGRSGPPPVPAATPTPQAIATIEDASANPAASEAAAAPPEPTTPTTDWKIDERTDPMSDQIIKTACVTSSNQVYLSSPYGARGAKLCIRQHPSFGRDVYLTLDGSGQILCRSYSNCTIPIRFDDKPVQSFSGGEPSDNSSETVFIVNDGRFITAAKAASRIRVQLEFYQNGAQTFDFPARGLEW